MLTFVTNYPNWDPRENHTPGTMRENFSRCKQDGICPRVRTDLWCARDQSALLWQSRKKFNGAPHRVKMTATSTP